MKYSNIEHVCVFVLLKTHFKTHYFKLVSKPVTDYIV